MSLECPAPDSESLAFRALSQSGCGALVADNEARIVYVNPRLCEITGYSAEELIGRNPRILQSGNTPRETYLTLWNRVSSGKPWHGILQNRKKTGELYWEAITISPIENAVGAITHFSAILEDVTDEKLSQSVQTEIDEELFREEKRECLEAMAVGLSHDLNNSLSCIVAACHLARKANYNAAKISEMLDHVESAARRSSEYVRQVSNLWRPPTTDFVAIDALELLETRRHEYCAAAGTHSLRVKKTDDSTPIAASPALVHEAVSALLRNACEASADSPIEISCGTIARFQPEDDEHFIPCGLTGLSVVYIEVKDNGCGLDSYALRRAFNPFFTTKQGHRGLGLATVYGIMTGHKGAIGVISSPEKGTRVRLYFRKSGTVLEMT